MTKRLHNFFEKYAEWFCFILAVFASIVYATLSLVRHAHFQSGAFDLGLFDQAVWQYAHFLFPFNTIKMRMILGDHMTLTLPFLAPLYWIWDDVRLLLIFQAFWVSFSSVGIFLYLKKRELSALVSLMLSQMYLYFYGIQFGLFFDFHPVLIGVGLASWTVYFWETGRWKWFGVFVGLLLLTQENMGFVLAALAIIWFFQGKRRKLAIIMGIVGTIASTIAFKAIPLFSNVGLEYIPSLPHTPSGYITQFFDSPEKRQVLLYTFSWYSFLPIFSPGSFMAILSDLAQYFLTGPSFARMWSPFMHHRAILSLYGVIGSADVLLFLKTRKIPPVVPAICIFIIALLLNYHFHFAVNKLLHRDFWQQEEWMQNNEFIIQQIPPKVSVAAQQSLVPHISHREQIYLIYPRQHWFGKKSPCGQNQCWWLDFAGKPDYLFVDTHDNEWLTMTLESIDNFRTAIANMEKSGAITLIKKRGEARLYKTNSDKFQELGI